MSMMLKFLLLTFVLTTYVVINPTVSCYNDCASNSVGEASATTNANTQARTLSPARNDLATTESNSKLNARTNFAPLSPKPINNSSSQHPEKNNGHVVEGGIEGTGKFGDTNKLFEFDGQPLTPEQEIQKNSEGGEDGIEGTGRMALGNEHLIAYGPISRFGSIYVNGIKYEIDQAHVAFVNDQALTQLQVGMVVKVQADWTSQGGRTFDAQKVWFDQQLKGPVSNISHTSFGTQLNVLGTLVNINEDTVLENMLLKNLKVGHVLTISGITDGDDLMATYVARRSLALGNNQLVEIEAEVLSVNATQQRMVINGIDINTRDAKWAGAHIETLNKGDTVEVLGHYHPAKNSLKATSITVKNAQLKLVNGNKLSLDGMISLYQSNGHFYLSGQKSNANDAEFLVGDASLLNNKVRIKANGRIDDSGVFIIRTIEVVQPTNASIRASINSVDASSGAIALLGVTGHTKRGTLFQSKLIDSNKFFNIDNLSPGDWVELKGKWADNTFTLNTVNAIAAQKVQVLKGQIQKLDNGKISLLGITILTNNLLTDTQINHLKSGDFLLIKGEMLDAYTFNAASIILD